MYHDCTVYNTKIDFVYMSFTAMFVPSVVLLALYGTTVGVVIYRHRKLNASVAPEPPGGTSTPLQKEQAARRQRRSIRVATTCAVVTLMFLACWLPTWVMAFLVMFEVVEVRLRFLHWAIAVTYFHPCVNPVVYVIVDDRFRSVFLQIVQRKNVIAHTSGAVT